MNLDIDINLGPKFDMLIHCLWMVLQSITSWIKNIGRSWN